VVAWLAGEEWALQAFRDGRDIYVETAERMGGLTRKEGKVAVLALGYNGGTNSLEAMGAEGTKEQLQFLVNQWRNANENIVQMWAEMDNAFRVGDRPVGDRLFIRKDGKDRYLELPSGRAIGYHDLKARWITDKWDRRRKVVSFADPKKRGLRTDTYGGRLTENVTQAVARDILSEAVVRLHNAGHKVVGHVHDEILVEDTDGFSPVDVVNKIMTIVPDWAEGLPLDGEGYSTARYRKD
jgi:DNA polymerase